MSGSIAPFRSLDPGGGFVDKERFLGTKVPFDIDAQVFALKAEGVEVGPRRIEEHYLQSHASSFMVSLTEDTRILRPGQFPSSDHS
jgi:hypothetical protein